LNGSGAISGQASSAVAVAAAADHSFAVLPFVNLSGDPTQEYFSDGLIEEITSALARIRELEVVGRTSAIEFKGKNQNLRAIGEALHARYLLEGSVRKAGDRLRVTAQLIEASRGVHLWTENYDRKLTDVFAIQEEIATAIAGALRVPLGLKQGERLVTSRTEDVESYQDYLRARALFRSGEFGSTEAAIRTLERVVARAPDFAPAWAVLSRTYSVAPGRTVAGRSGSFAEARRGLDATLRRSDRAAQRAVELDPSLPDGYLALGRLAITRGDRRRRAKVSGDRSPEPVSGELQRAKQQARHRDHQVTEADDRIVAAGLDVLLQKGVLAIDVLLQRRIEMIDVLLRQQLVGRQVRLGGQQSGHVPLHGIDDGPGLVGGDVDAYQRIIHAIEGVHVGGLVLSYGRIVWPSPVSPPAA
jgi:TolB-like protein